MPKLLGIIGLLVICAGIDLLWHSRQEIKFWIIAYLAFFRALLHNRASLPLSSPPEKRPTNAKAACASCSASALSSFSALCSSPSASL